VCFMNLDLLMVVLCLLFVVQLFSIICVDNTIIHIAWLTRNFRGAVRSVNCMCYVTRWSHRLGCCIRIVLLPLDWCKILPWSQTRWLSVSYCPRQCQQLTAEKEHETVGSGSAENRKSVRIWFSELNHPKNWHPSRWFSDRLHAIQNSD